MEQVVLVDQADNEVGTMEKMEAHRKGLLHRAFSICIFNADNEMMLQRRAAEKYHSGNLWTNTCCSHPRPEETVLEAAKRRLVEEMGFQCDMREVHAFVYRAELDQGLIEHELDHVLFGEYEGKPEINPEEVSEWKYMSLDAIEEGIKKNPQEYTEWFKLLFPEVKKLRS